MYLTGIWLGDVTFVPLIQSDQRLSRAPLRQRVKPDPLIWRGMPNSI